MNLDTTIVQSKTARELIDFIDELIDIIDDKEHFTIDTKNKYPEYSRGLETNRLCFSRVWDGRKTYGTQ